MAESTVTSTRGAIKWNFHHDKELEAPQDLLKLMEKHQESKIDGYIYGNNAVKMKHPETENISSSIQSYFHRGNDPVANKGDETMNNHDSTDTLFKELKIDMREREERSRKEISDREERYERQLERFAQESQQREERIRQETKEREERIEKMINGVNSKVEDHAKYFESIKNQNFWGNITVFVALVAILVTLMLALFNQ
ncbi:hypothetical protein [Planococcus sp. SSTMD024]|uniref:hypothetical protein n=1 Tax=Planococcus sp. SSTMD024 TaxID=3242163 RepID=UPI00351E7287